MVTILQPGIYADVPNEWRHTFWLQYTVADGAFPFFTDNDYNKPVRDPRLYETMLVNGANFGDHAAELWLGGRDNIDNTEKETGKVLLVSAFINSIRQVT